MLLAAAAAGAALRFQLLCNVLRLMSRQDAEAKQCLAHAGLLTRSCSVFKALSAFLPCSTAALRAGDPPPAHALRGR
jgi:hypothetical protein